MSLFAQQIASLASAIYRPSPNPAAEIARQKSAITKQAIFTLIEKYGPIGETEIAKRSGLSRTNVHHNLAELERRRQIRRASDKPRSPWVAVDTIKARLVTFETPEDVE